ncbi:MAG TPA: cytochrome c oxidase subunit 3, partial [Ilumatobacteraceae bacterium]|nr:cytochrome c oxidase subunit 3 [Ilumatobacteraceae bacterium]
MHALAPAPAPAPRRQVFVGTALTCGAATALVGGMVALWMRFREVAINGPDHRWIPEDVSVPMVAANVMLIALVPLCIFAQWAVYSAKRDDQTHAGLALALTGLMGISFINAQAYVWVQMKVPADVGAYGSLFYAVTGVSLVLAIAGVAFSGVVA